MVYGLPSITQWNYNNMTPSKLLKIVKTYREFMSQMGARPVRLTPDQQQSQQVTYREVINHLAYMVDQVPIHAKGGKVEKAFRWLGFIQGVLWCSGVRTLQELRSDNRSDPEGLNETTIETITDIGIGRDTTTSEPQQPAADPIRLQ